MALGDGLYEVSVEDSERPSCKIVLFHCLISREQETLLGKAQVCRDMVQEEELVEQMHFPYLVWQVRVES